MRSKLLLALAFLGLAFLGLGCGSWTELDEHDCPPEGTESTYDNFGKGFFSLYCNGCHAVAAEDRRGAPQAYVFDTYDQVYVLRERIFIRAAADNISMPPGPDDPPAHERDQLADWIACGAPEKRE